MGSRSFAAGALALVVLLGCSVSSATAECRAWELLSKFNAIQANGFAVVFDVGEIVDGSGAAGASYYSDNGPVEGRAQVTFDGNAFTALVQWPAGNDPRGGPLGMYEGGIDSQGSLSGITYQLGGQVRNEVHWRSKQTFHCAAVAEAPAKPVRRLGKKKSNPPPPEDSGIIMQPDIKGLIQ